MGCAGAWVGKLELRLQGLIIGGMHYELLFFLISSSRLAAAFLHPACPKVDILE